MKAATAAFGVAIPLAELLTKARPEQVRMGQVGPLAAVMEAAGAVESMELAAMAVPLVAAALARVDQMSGPEPPETAPGEKSEFGPGNIAAVFALVSV